MKNSLRSLGLITVVLMSGGALAQPLTLQYGDGNSAVRALTLGGFQNVMIDVIASQEFSGRPIALTVQRPTSFDSTDFTEEVVASVSPETLELAPGQTGKVMVTFRATPAAPSFAPVDFGLQAVTSAEVTTMSIGLKVDPTLEIRLYGGEGPEIWSEVWSLPPVVSLRKHAGGVLVRFVNYDANDEHVIHGQGAIPHGPVDRPLARSVNGQPGGVYEVKVTSTAPVTGTYYCHEHESGLQAKQIKFNAVP